MKTMREMNIYWCFLRFKESYDEPKKQAYELWSIYKHSGMTNSEMLDALTDWEFGLFDCKIPFETRRLVINKILGYSK